jgi:hypothetical protein
MLPELSTIAVTAALLSVAGCAHQPAQKPIGLLQPGSVVIMLPLRICSDANTVGQVFDATITQSDPRNPLVEIPLLGSHARVVITDIQPRSSREFRFRIDSITIREHTYAVLGGRAVTDAERTELNPAGHAAGSVCYGKGLGIPGDLAAITPQ